MHYRIFSILVTFVCLFGCALTTAAQDVNNTDETEKPVILYSGTPKKYEIADIKVEGAQNYEGLCNCRIVRTIQRADYHRAG